MERNQPCKFYFFITLQLLSLYIAIDSTGIHCSKYSSITFAAPLLYKALGTKSIILFLQFFHLVLGLMDRYRLLWFSFWLCKSSYFNIATNRHKHNFNLHITWTTQDVVNAHAANHGYTRGLPFKSELHMIHAESPTER